MDPSSCHHHHLVQTVFCQNGSIVELSSVTGLHVLIWTGPVFTKSCLPQMNVKLLIWGKEYVCDVASCSKAELKEKNCAECQTKKQPFQAIIKQGYL